MDDELNPHHMRMIMHRDWKETVDANYRQAVLVVFCESLMENRSFLVWDEMASSVDEALENLVLV